MVEQLKDAAAEVSTSLGRGMAERGPFAGVMLLALIALIVALFTVSYILVSSIIDIKLEDQKLEIARAKQRSEQTDAILSLEKANAESRTTLLQFLERAEKNANDRLVAIEERDRANHERGMMQVESVHDQLQQIISNQNLRSIIRPHIAPPPESQ